MSIEQGTLFTDITETVIDSAVDPVHFQGTKKVIKGYAVGPSFDDDKVSGNAVQEPSQLDDSSIPEVKSFVDSNELVSSVMRDVSGARQLEGLIKGGLSSARIHQRAEKRRSTVQEVYDDALRRSGDYHDMAEQEYRKWIVIGSALVSFATQKNVAPTPFTRFQETYWGSKAADRRRAKLQRRLKK